VNASSPEAERAAPRVSRQDKLEYFVFRAGVGAFASLPRPLALRFGAALGELFYRLDARDRAIALFNLRLAFPESDEGEHRRILRESCRNLGRVGAEICQLSRLTRAELPRYVGFRDEQAWSAAIEDIETNGGLILTGHFGNWEMLAYAHGLLGHPITLVHRPMRNPLVEDGIARLRGGAGTRALAKRAAAKEVIRTLRRKGIVVIPIDQNQSAGLGVFVDFFGKPACTTFGLARLARLTGAPVYPVFLVRQGSSDRHLIEVLPRVDWVETGDAEADIVANTQRYTTVFEGMLRQYPEQWIWFHKRWRTRPAGEAQFY
jgi:Kdo2-lipid IVA lauroyltransferase/acyltransferase